MQKRVPKRKPKAMPENEDLQRFIAEEMEPVNELLNVMAAASLSKEQLKNIRNRVNAIIKALRPNNPGIQIELVVQADRERINAALNKVKISIKVINLERKAQLQGIRPSDGARFIPFMLNSDVSLEEYAAFQGFFKPFGEEKEHAVDPQSNDKANAIIAQSALSSQNLALLKKVVNQNILMVKKSMPGFRLTPIEGTDEKEIRQKYQQMEVYRKVMTALMAASQEKISETETILGCLAKKGVDITELREYVALTEGAAKNSEESNLKQIQAQIDALRDLDLPSENSQEAFVLEVMKMQLYAVYQLRAVLLSAVLGIKKQLRTIPRLVVELDQQLESHPLIKQFFSLACYFSTSEAYTLSLNLERHQEKYTAFAAESGDMSQLIKQILPELKPKAVAELTKKLTEVRQLVLLTSAEYFSNLKMFAVMGFEKRAAKMRETVLQCFITQALQHPILVGDKRALVHLRTDLTVLLKNLTNPSVIDSESTAQGIYFGELKATDFFASIAKPDVTVESKTEKHKKKLKKKKSGQKSKVTDKPKSAAPVSQQAVTDVKAAACNEPEGVVPAVPEKKDSAPSPAQFFKPKVEKFDELLADLKEMSEFKLPAEMEGKVEVRQVPTVLSLQTNAIFFAARQLLDKRMSHANPVIAREARCLRHALVHCKDFIDEAALVVGSLHAEVVRFADLLVKSIEIPQESKLTADPFYQRALAHGEMLVAQLARGERERDTYTPEDALYYTAHLRAQWMQYNIAEHIPVTEKMYQFAIKNVADKMLRYTGLKLNRKAVRVFNNERHSKGTSIPILPEVGLAISRSPQVVSGPYHP